MRTQIILKTILVLVVVIWHSSFAYSNEYSALKVKVWVSSEELQIQFTEPETSSSAIINIQYDRKVTSINLLQHASVSKSGGQISPILQRLVSGVDQLKIALVSVNDINNVEAINLNGPTDLTYVGEDNVNAKWVDGVFLPLTMPVLEHLKSLTTKKEKDFYRLNLLLKRISDVLDAELMERQSDVKSTCAQYVAAN